jgi:predicted aspartyl protease
MATPYTDDVPYFEPQASGGFQLVTDQIDENNSKADEFIELFVTALENLGETEEYSPDFSELVKEVKELVLPKFPDRPNIDTTLNTDWPSMDIQEPTFYDVPLPPDYVFPDAPDSINPYFEYSPGEYNSLLWRPLRNALLKDLEQGGTGLTEEVYAAILDKEVSARQDDNDGQRIRLDRLLGSTGMMPSGVSATARIELENRITRDNKTALETILIKDFDLAVQNTQFTKSLCQTVEEMLRSDFNSKEERLFNIASASKELTIRIYEANAGIYNSKIEGVKLKLETAKARADIIIERNRSESEVFKSRAEVLQSKIDAISSQNKAITEAATAEANIYSTDVQAVATEINALIREVEVSRDDMIAEINKVLGKEGLNLQSFSSVNELKTEKLVSTARLLAQAVASALGMTNTGLNYGTSYNRSQSHSFGLSNSRNESYTP